MPFGGLLTAGVGGGLGFLSGLFGKKQTQTQNGSSTPTYSADQSQLQSSLAQTLMQRLQNPGVDLDPLKTAAIGGVNRTYDAASKRLENQFASRGFGQSGKLVTNQRGNEIARAGSIGGLESQFAGMQLDQQNHIYDLIQKFAFANPGQKTTGNITGTSGGGIGGGIDSGLSTFTTLFGLNKLLSGNQGGGATPPYVGDGFYGGEDGIS